VILSAGPCCRAHQETHGNLKMDESCISKPKSEMAHWTETGPSESSQTVQSDLSDFGFEMQDSSTFEFQPDDASIYVVVGVRTAFAQAPARVHPSGGRGLHEGSGLNCWIDSAFAAVSSPRSRCQTTPSWLTMKVMIPLAP